MSLFEHHVTSNELIALYQKHDNEAICQCIEAMLHDYEQRCYNSLCIEDQETIDSTVAAILFIFSQPDFSIPTKLIPTLIMMGHLMANLVALSSYETTDCFLQHIMNQKGNFAKILFMYSCRNKPIFKQEIFFDLNPKLATLWWLTYAGSTCGVPSKLIEDNVSRHYASIPKKFELVLLNVCPAYFDCTYAYPQQDRKIKSILNSQMRKRLPYYQYAQKTNKKHIAVFTGRWFATSAVYKASAHQLAALSKKYNLTLVHLGEDDEKLDKSIFKNVIITGNVSQGQLDLNLFKSLDCHLAYLPDIGMSSESVALANVRLAPIMVTGYGHPSSTFGSLCDYFIGGQEIELVDRALENYSEKLVLVPGLGAHPVFPNYQRRNPKFERPIINCAWTSAKINYTMLINLRKILDAIPGAMVRLFPSHTIGRYNSMIPCLKDLNKLFGDEFALNPEMPYQDYLIEMEKGTIGLDSYPFGGFNTIIDNFFVGVPVIAIEGHRFYNKASSALLRRVGLEDLVVHSQDEYVAKAIELLTDADKLRIARAKLAAIDHLRKLLCDNDEAGYFVKAFDWILENHDKIKKSREKGPFLIK